MMFEMAWWFLDGEDREGYLGEEQHVQRAGGLCLKGSIRTFGRCEGQQPHCPGLIGDRTLGGQALGLPSPPSVGLRAPGWLPWASA